jgi:glyoxylase-like metal-dependent hydrolase (beta-lactamase superfamily II)
MYKITALDYGYQIYPAQFVFFGASFDEWVRVELYLFVLQGGGKNVLIDAGMSKIHAEYSNPYITANLGEKGEFIIREDPLDLLQEHKGLKENDIDYIYIIHFHLDHVCNLPMFKKSKFIVSRRNFSEVVAPRHPEMVPPIIFPREAIHYLMGEANDRLLLIDDHQEILPGIDMFTSGGHTLGHQTIRVLTNKGYHFFPMDNLPFYKNLEKHIPVGNPVNLSQAYDALKIAEREQGVVVVPHDPILKEKYPDGEIV